MIWRWSRWLQILVWLQRSGQRNYSLGWWRLSVDPPLLILQLNAEGGGSHFATCWESEQFSPLTVGPQLQITSSAVWAPTATSSAPDWWRNGGKINGFLSRKSRLCHVWEFDVTLSYSLTLLCGKLKAEFEQADRREQTGVSQVNTMARFNLPLSLWGYQFSRHFKPTGEDHSDRAEFLLDDS